MESIHALLESNVLDADRFIQAVALEESEMALPFCVYVSNSLAMRECILKTPFGTKDLVYGPLEIKNPCLAYETETRILKTKYHDKYTTK